MFLALAQLTEAILQIICFFVFVRSLFSILRCLTVAASNVQANEKRPMVVRLSPLSVIWYPSLLNQDGLRARSRFLASLRNLTLAFCIAGLVYLLLGAPK